MTDSFLIPRCGSPPFERCADCTETCVKHPGFIGVKVSADGGLPLPNCLTEALRKKGGGADATE